MVWHVVIWYIWKIQNDVIFNGVTNTTKEGGEKRFFLLGIGFWVGIGRNLAPSQIGFITLSFAYTYNISSVSPDLERIGGSSFPLD